LGTSSELLDRLLARDHDAVGEKGRTIALLHGARRPRAFVLLHGLSASPAQFERFAHELFARGHNVVVPRLPRHGHADRLSTALERLTGEDLRAAARESVLIGRDLGERVTVAGFSLGGLLAAYVAQTELVERSVAIAPFFGVSRIPSAWMAGISDVLLRLPNFFPWWDPIKREKQMPAHGYPRYASHAIAHAHRLASELLHLAIAGGPVARHTVLVTNAREAAVNNRAILRLYARWSAHRPGAVEHVILNGLPLSHDIIEPLNNVALAARVFPQLLETIDPADAG
jgi:pimeloyl-ACP methyl ester carboxylesterase